MLVSRAKTGKRQSCDVATFKVDWSNHLPIDLICVLLL